MSVDVGLRIQTYFSPDDDCQDALIAFVKGTTGHLRIADYAFHLPPLVDVLISLHKQGADVALILDESQEHGRYEGPEVHQLVLAGVDVTVGTSQRHEIMHHKFIVRDKTAVLSGSYNFSLSAEKEANYFDIIESADRAALFLSKWQELHDWIRANEPQYQVEGE